MRRTGKNTKKTRQYFHQPKTVTKNTALPIANKYFLFLLSVKTFKTIIAFIKVQFHLLSCSAMVALFHNNSTAFMLFSVTHIYFKILHANPHFLFFHLFSPKNIYLFALYITVFPVQPHIRSPRTNYKKISILDCMLINCHALQG